MRTDPGRMIPVEGSAPVPRRRLRSLDAFRGAVLAFMLLTPATGRPEHFPFLRHAAWEGATASDVILPTFLVTSGLSLAFLLRPPTTATIRWRLVRRLVALVAIGLVYNAYGTTGFDLAQLRFTGVLQLIGVSGFVAAVVVLGSRRSDGGDRTGVIAAAAAGLPALYGVGLAVLGERCPGSEPCSPYGGIDAAVLGEAHTYGAGVPGYDPEGLAVSVAAAGLVLVGYLAGAFLRRHADRVGTAVVGRIVAAGLAALGAAAVLDGLQPVSKRRFTPAFVALSSGVALLGLASVVAALDAGSVGDRVRTVVSWPFVALGRNALVVYVSERFLLQSAGMVHLGDQTVRDRLLDALPIAAPGVHLAYTVVLLALVTALASLLHASRRYVAL